MCCRTLVIVLGLALIAGPAAAEEESPPDAGQAMTPAEAPSEPPIDTTAEAPSEAPPETNAEAAEPEAEPPMTAKAYARESAPILHGRLELSLEDAIAMGLENNLDVQVQRYAPLIADYDESIAWGAFDPTLFSEFGYSDSKTPNSNILFGTTENVNRGVDGFGGLRGILPLLSTEYSAQFDGSRSTNNSSILALSPQYDSDWSLSITQPVLRDLVWNQPWTQVKTSRLLLESSQENFRTSVMDTVRSIEDAYWTLIAANEGRRVAQKSLETAKALLDQTKTQYEVGVVSKVEVTEAEAGLSQREVSLIRAENQYRNQQDVLIDLVLGPGLRSNSTLEIAPTDQPQEYTPYTVDVPAAVEQAFENRPELVAAKKEIQRQNVQLKFAKNQRLPALDGIFSFGQKGLAGDKNSDFNPCRFSSDPMCDPNDPALDPSQGGFNNTFDDYNDSPQFAARARLSIPIPNTSARNTVSKSQLQLRRAETQKKRLEQGIILEVRQSARNLKASQEGIVAAKAAQTAAEEQLRAERIRLEYGESTPFDVLQREEQLVDRENELIGAFQAYRISVSALDRAQGTILRNRNIRIDEVGALR